MNCPVCHISISSFSLYRSHFQGHSYHRRDTLRLPCPSCDRAFISWNSLYRHFQRTHCPRKADGDSPLESSVADDNSVSLENSFESHNTPVATVASRADLVASITSQLERLAARRSSVVKTQAIPSLSRLS